MEPTISTYAPEMTAAGTALQELQDVLEQSGIEQSLLGLQRAVSEASNREAFTPPVPETLVETGLHFATVEQLILKHLYNRGEVIGRELANLLGLKFSLIDGILDGLKRQHIAQVKGSLGFGAVSSVFSLSEVGRARARDCLEHNQYCGAAPVPVSQYATAVRAQSLHNGWLKREALLGAFGHMVIQPEVVNQVGPAVNSGKSFLIYGQPGNGKTYLAEALFRLESPNIIFPTPSRRGEDHLCFRQAVSPGGSRGRRSGVSFAIERAQL